MSQFVETGGSTPLTFNQRWNTYLVLAMVVTAVALGMTLRRSAVNATQTFENLEAGVRAQVPVGWLMDSGGTEYVFRAQDPDALPFKTTLQVSVLPIGPDATPNIVLDLLFAERAPRFPLYTEVTRSPVTLRGGDAMRMVYAYAQIERNPFQAVVPLMIEGVDVVVLRRGQAVIITYREERSAFEANLYRFENLLQTVEIF